MIKLKNITKIYNNGPKNECTALKDINLELPSHGLVLITGKSGCGKTTLLNLIAGLDSPTEGTLENNYGINFYSIIFQDFQLIDYLTIEQNLMMIVDLMKAQMNLYWDLIDRYELLGVLNNYPNQISGGEKQRVAIVRAILENRPVVLCDEPTGSLDENNAKKIAKLLKSEASSKLVIVVSHDKEIFNDFSDMTIELKNGKIVNEYSIINIESETIVNQNINVFLTKKTRWLLTKSFFRKNLMKHFLLILTLVLTFLILLTSFNSLLNKKSTVVYNIYQKVGSEILDLSLSSGSGYYHFTEKQYESYRKKYPIEAQFYDLNFEFNFNDVASVSRVYVSNKTSRKMLYGGSEINNGEILISDYLATKLINNQNVDFSSLIGKKIICSDDDFVIRGIYETGYLKNQSEEKYDNLSYQYQTIYVTEQDYLFLINNMKSTGCRAILNESKADIFMIHNNGDFESKLFCGEYGDLKKGEIGISLDVAKYYTDIPESLIGNKIKIIFYQQLDSMNLSKIEKNEYEFTVKYIYQVFRNPEINMMSDDYYAIACYQNLNLYGNVRGISIHQYNKNNLSKLFNEGFIDNTSLSNEIWSGIVWLETLTIIEFVLGIVLLIISFVVIINFIHSILAKEKRTLGILVSLGIERRTTIQIYMLDLAMCILSSIVIVSILEIFTVIFLNTLLKTIGISNFNLIYFTVTAVFILVFIMILLLVVIYYKFDRIISKKQIIDIIYEK